ncbi:MAG TPA: hypothetical protein PLN52_24155 [Opitutaceae bacterium]|nr:hypothetical protein [Opitutaceae bacterium]
MAQHERSANMSPQVVAPDLGEKYQAHAYWALAFICDCGEALELPANHRQFSKSYFEQMAKEAKAGGWTLPDLKDEDSVPEMVCYCPKCSLKQ